MTPGNIKLRAVNEILRAIGEPPVDELDTGGTSEIAEAEQILDEQNVRIQGRGWHVNTILERAYEPDGNGQIELDNALHIRPVLPGHGPTPRQTDPNRLVNIRAGKLYDLVADTDTFDGPVHLEVIELLDFESLPGVLRDYITAVAAVEFQVATKRGEIDDQAAQRKMMMAKIAAEQAETDMGNINVLDTPDVQRIRGHRNARYF